MKMILAEVRGADKERKTLMVADESAIRYKRLVIAAGTEYHYFGRDDWRMYAPGLKTIHEAREIRHRLLLAFEAAERATDEVEKQALLTSIVIGGGPTGVEMAGAIWRPFHDRTRLSQPPTGASMSVAG